jgi:prevent-host-death family protein
MGGRVEGAVGIRIFRDRLTRYVARVRRGHRVVVTDRGKPVAVLVPYEGAVKTAPEEARLAMVLASGHVTASERRLDTRFTPVRGKGQPPSRMIIESRR